MSIETFIESLGASPMLSREENRDLFIGAVQDVDGALEQFILANTRLVTTALHRFFKGQKCAYYLIDDLFSVGLTTLTTMSRSLVKKMKTLSDQDLQEVRDHWVSQDSKILKIPPYLYTAIYISIRVEYEKDSGQPLSCRTRQRRTTSQGKVTRKIDTSPHIYEEKSFSGGGEQDIRDLYQDILDTAQTKEEKRILVLRRSNHSDYEISAIMGISQPTVYRIRQRLYKRFQRKNS